VSTVSSERKLLVIDSAFSYQAIRSRGLEGSVTCRDLRGYFRHVWSVHPLASMVSEPPVSRSGRADVHHLAERHTFIDGKIGRFRWLEWAPRLNFALAQLSLLWQLCNLIRKEGIGVIRVAGPLYNGMLGLALARLMRIPLLVRVGSNDDKTYETTGVPMMPRLFNTRRTEKRVTRFVLERADCVAGANQDNLNFALANGAHPERTTLFRYGNLIDLLHFAEPTNRSIMHDWLQCHAVEPHRFLMFVGRLEPVKQPEDVLRVLAELLQRNHRLKLLMVGDGRLRERLADTALELGIKREVIFCGNQNQHFLASMYPLAAAVLSPHTGRALSEAALAGIPIIAYDIDWQGELIETGVTGELVEDRNWLQMADAVERVLTDPAHARRIGEAVRRRALAMMDPERLDQHERDTYTRMLSRG
jgi:glycosyltransferase involved in cell wall biosynthesis